MDSNCKIYFNEFLDSLRTGVVGVNERGEFEYNEFWDKNGRHGYKLPKETNAEYRGIHEHPTEDIPFVIYKDEPKSIDN